MLDTTAMGPTAITPAITLYYVFKATPPFTDTSVKKPLRVATAVL